MDNIELVFDDDAIKAVAEKSIRLKTGARGLRSVIENMMLDCMYEVPSIGDVAKIKVSRGCVEELQNRKLSSVQADLTRYKRPVIF